MEWTARLLPTVRRIQERKTTFERKYARRDVDRLEGLDVRDLVNRSVLRAARPGTPG